MIDTSQIFQEILETDFFDIPKVTIGADVFGLAKLVSVQTSVSAFPSSGPSYGRCVSRKITLEMRHPGSTFPPMAEITLENAISDGVQVSENIPQGHFYLDTQEEGENSSIPTLAITGMDAIMLLEEDISGVQYPITDLAFVKKAAALMGVSIEPITRAAINHGYQIESTDDEYCWRERMSEIAGLYGGVFFINKANQLALANPGLAQQRGIFAAGARTETLWTEDAYKAITRIKLYDDSTMYTSGTNSGRRLVQQTISPSQAKANHLLSIASAWPRYQPFEARNIMLSPAADLGDRISVGRIDSVIFSMSEVFGGLHISTVSAVGGENIDHEIPYRSPASRAAGRAASGVARATKAIRKTEQDYTELYARLYNTEDGDIVVALAGVSALVTKDPETGDYKATARLEAMINDESANMLAHSELATQVSTNTDTIGKTTEALASLSASVYDELDGCVRQAYLELYAVSDGQGNSRTLAELVADVLNLNGNVNVQGNLYVSGGNVVSKETISSLKSIVAALNITANGNLSAGGNLRVGEGTNALSFIGSSGVLSAPTGKFNTLKIGTDTYNPKSITSTSGAVQALGA